MTQTADLNRLWRKLKTARSLHGHRKRTLKQLKRFAEQKAKDRGDEIPVLTIRPESSASSWKIEFEQEVGEWWK